MPASTSGFLTRSCNRCESLPEPIKGSGNLFIWFPIGHSFGKVLAGLKELHPRAESRPDVRCVVLPVESGVLAPALRQVAELLTSEEVRAARVFFKEGEGEPGFADFPQVSALDRFLALGDASWLVEMLAEKRLLSHFQPIVHARTPNKIYAFEALLRGLDDEGKLVSPGRILEWARKADLMFQVDLAARTSAIRGAVKHGLRAPIFINFTPTSIYDPAFCLKTTVQAVRDAGMTPGDVVFEVIESDQVADVKHLLNIMAYYRERGFRVALDDVGSGYSSLNLIHQLRPDIMKLDMELIRNVDRDPYKGAVTEKLLQLAQQLGVQTIAEGIETREELAWVQERGVDFVQGYLIARPAAPPLEPSI